MTDQVRRLFDAKAAAWPAKYAPGGPLAGRLDILGRAVLAHTGPGCRVLDLGCGTGELAYRLAGAGRYTAGCDISRPMLLGAAAGDGARVAGWVQLDPGWRRLPFAAAAFDAVVASSVLEYAADPALILRDCARVLRPDGVLVCTVPDLRHPARWLEWLARAPVARRAAGRLTALDRRWPRWSEYRAYLRGSRQRHPARWWLTEARQAGLRPRPGAGGHHGALRVFVFGPRGAAGGPG
jgi:SAM-dependent methyltransferase